MYSPNLYYIKILYNLQFLFSLFAIFNFGFTKNFGETLKNVRIKPRGQHESAHTVPETINETVFPAFSYKKNNREPLRQAYKPIQSGLRKQHL